MAAAGELANVDDDQLAASFGSLAAAAPVGGAEKPKVIVTISDDVGWAEFGFHALLATNSRAAVAKADLEGCQRRGIFGLPLSETLFPQPMKGLGVVTCCIGNWRLVTARNICPCLAASTTGLDDEVACAGRRI